MVCDRLGITMVQFCQLQRNPTFPKPVFESRFVIEWAGEDIDQFKAQMDEVAERGWKVPEALYAWSVDYPEDWAREWDRIQQAIKRRRRA
jgi:hypothetical protein